MLVIAWLVMLSSMIAVGGAAAVCMFYVVKRTHRFYHIKKLARTHRWLSWAAAMSPVLVCAAFASIRIVAMYVVVFHLTLFWIICDIAAMRVQRYRKNKRLKARRAEGYKPRKRIRRRYTAGYVAMLMTVVYLGYGWYMAHHIVTTRYDVSSDKDTHGQLHVVMIADSHIGITFDGEGFAEQCRRISAMQPDIVLLPGDFVDDDTSTRDMKRACRALGEIESKYGVYVSHGNHDPGFFGYRDFTIDELDRELRAAGVHLLDDETELVDGRFYVTGREDKSDRKRMTMAELSEELDSTVYQIVLDHQPNDFEAEAKAQADLVVSGHTHGGHIFPAGYFGKLLGFNDRIYGSERRGSTTFIVTSGISGWAIPFKTGCCSEIVDIYVN